MYLSAAINPMTKRCILTVLHLSSCSLFTICQHPVRVVGVLLARRKLLFMFFSCSVCMSILLTRTFAKGVIWGLISTNPSFILGPGELIRKSHKTWKFSLCLSKHHVTPSTYVFTPLFSKYVKLRASMRSQSA